jgi:hypothetical protein
MKDEALKLALEALDIVKIHFTQNRHVNEAITAIKQALAAPVQEPVYVKTFHGGKPWPLHPAPVQEPFGYFKAEPFGWIDCAERDEGAVALYEHPAAQRQWVGLTQQEVQEIHDTYHKRMGPQEFAAILEAKLKEKNT